MLFLILGGLKIKIVGSKLKSSTYDDTFFSTNFVSRYLILSFLFFRSTSPVIGSYQSHFLGYKDKLESKGLTSFFLKSVSLVRSKMIRC